MTPKEKAKQLISKFTFLKLPEHDAKFYNPKQCALIAVEEILADIKRWDRDVEVIENDEVDSPFLFWLSVKIEIQKL